MRVLAIGDIHGCLRALDALLAAVSPRPADLVVTLGDYVDRGPDSRGVLDRLVALHATGRLVPILGNHDQMMLDARSGDPEKQWWLTDYGVETLASYGEGASLDSVPRAHWDFLEKQCLPYHEIDTHFFVHASAYADQTLEDQPVFMLRWESFGEPAPHVSGKVMICGHSAQKSGRPLNVGHAVCIDTWVYGRGWLTCLDVRTGEVWQANERGEVRRARIEDFE
jgi:serine/threonine protein phosphatase 1